MYIPEEWVLRTPEGVASGFLIKGKGGQSEPGRGRGGRKRAGLDTLPSQAGTLAASTCAGAESCGSDSKLEES